MRALQNIPPLRIQKRQCQDISPAYLKKINVGYVEHSGGDILNLKMKHVLSVEHNGDIISLILKDFTLDDELMTRMEIGHSNYAYEVSVYDENNQEYERFYYQ